jgi:hypothetical protein
VNIDITTPLQSQLTGISNALTALQGEDTAQTTLNNQLTNDITTLQTGKQNVIDNSNKISSSNVSYNASDVSTELTSLNSVLGNKAPLANPTFTGTVSGIDKTMVGLTNIDNTSDASKPVSTAQQTALNLKADLSGSTFTGLITTPSVKVTTGATNGYVMTSDATGNGLWSAPSGGALTYVNGAGVSPEVFPAGTNYNGQWRTYASVTIPTAGVWLFSSQCGLLSNSGGTTISVTQANLSISTVVNSATGNIAGNSESLHAAISLGTANIQYMVAGTGFHIATVTAQTYYFNVWLGYSGTAGMRNNSTNSCAIKIA